MRVRAYRARSVPRRGDELHRRLAHRIDLLRREKGWSVNRFADFAGVNSGALWRILHGERSPTVRMLQKLADALETTVPALFQFGEGDGRPRKP